MHIPPQYLIAGVLIAGAALWLLVVAIQNGWIGQSSASPPPVVSGTSQTIQPSQPVAYKLNALSKLDQQKSLLWSYVDAKQWEDAKQLIDTIAKGQA